MSILQNQRITLVVLLFSFILLSPCSIIVAADEMPTFTEDDFADCAITGMMLDYAVHYETETETAISGEWWGENGKPQEPSTSFIRFDLSHTCPKTEFRK